MAPTTPPRTTNFTSPFRVTPSRTESDLSSSFAHHLDPEEDDAGHEGSKTNPIKVFLNTHQSSCTLHSFVPLFVPSMKRHGWTRPGFVVSKTYNIIDINNIKAEIPRAGEFPDYEGKCMLVEEPALDVYHRSSGHFHVGCPSTQAAYAGLEQKWKSGKMDSKKYFLLIFPDIVNNTHFSQSSDHTIETKDNFTSLEKDLSGNDTGEEVHTSIAYWELALENGGLKVEEKATPKKSRRELLAEQRAKREAAAALDLFG